MTRRVPNVGRAYAIVLVISSAICVGAACFARIVWGVR